MLFHRLSANIILNIVFVLVLAMLLIDVVIIRSTQQLMLKDEMAEGEFLISAISQNLDDYDVDSLPWPRSAINDIDTLVAQSDFSSVLVVKNNMEEIHFSGTPDIAKTELKQITRQVIKAGRSLTWLTGTTWGVFWKQKGFMVVSAPIFRAGTTVAGISIVYNLRQLYDHLRRMQRMIFFYILINTVILALIGFFRLSKITVKPLKKLVERAEAFREDDDEILFLAEKENSEFSQLSKALNRMFNHISEGREELKLTVCSLRQANVDLKKAQHDIINAEKLASVGRLTAGIAHEIGNPIAIIIGYLDLLKRQDISAEERNEFILRTEKEIGRVSKIIRQLLDFSRPSTGDLKTAGVHEILTDMVSMFHFQPVMSDISTRLSLEAEWDQVRADPGQLRQVFLNLIINAADAIAASADASGGELFIGTAVVTDPMPDARQMLKIEFRDNGPGIPQEHLGNIFDPFFTTKSPGKGTGLGLSVCFMIVEAMGGRIRALSRAGHGTSMIIHFPLEQQQTEHPKI
ncbi:hypothetical protein DENIS_3035 [Desulfonema ishimotonii]|uniref:histidine kinase n=1 Tax=Desulfonema ishimotonii TaxID=45657 RepID=A0A401FYJ3_9BACT|nr:sensor histidine kinase [Desulfonema ishimotonii]GBC62072.1 hypothetical protein DENIS_3035 [Desulfonema ishimotonii]